MFCYKLVKTKNETLLSVCDEEILGKTFSEGGIKLEVKKDFYYENKCEKDKIKEFCNKASIINVVGKSIVKLLIDEDVVDKDKILEIEDIPHAQVVKID